MILSTTSNGKHRMPLIPITNPVDGIVRADHPSLAKCDCTSGIHPEAGRIGCPRHDAAQYAVRFSLHRA